MFYYNQNPPNNLVKNIYKNTKDDKRSRTDIKQTNSVTKIKMTCGGKHRLEKPDDFQQPRVSSTTKSLPRIPAPELK